MSEKLDGYKAALAALQSHQATQALWAAATAGHPEVAADIRANNPDIPAHICTVCGEAKFHMSPKQFLYKGQWLQPCNSCAHLRLDFVDGEWIVLTKKRDPMTRSR